RRGIVTVPIRIQVRMRQPILERRRWAAQQRIQIAEGGAGLEPLPKPRAPVQLVFPEQLVLRRASPHQRQPLHEVWRGKIAAAGKVDSHRRRRHWNDGGQMWWLLAR